MVSLDWCQQAKSTLRFFITGFLQTPTFHRNLKSSPFCHLIVFALERQTWSANLSSKHYIRKDKRAPKKLISGSPNVISYRSFTFQRRETKWRGISLQLLTRNKMLKYHFLPLKSRLKKSLSKQTVWKYIMIYNESSGDENTVSEFGNTKIHICRCYQESKGFVNCSATENVWTSSNQINSFAELHSF